MQRSPGGTDEYKRAQAAINELRGGANEPREVQTSQGRCKRAKGGTDESRRLQTTPDGYRRTQEYRRGQATEVESGRSLVGAESR